LSLLTGTNKEYIDSRIPHLSSLMVNCAEKLIDSSEVIIINTKEKEFVSHLKNMENKIIIDMVRLDESLLKKANYVGINW
jgi:GDP-mannose 6-dehydrogenase